MCPPKSNKPVTHHFGVNDGSSYGETVKTVRKVLPMQLNAKDDDDDVKRSLRWYSRTVSASDLASA